MGMPQKLLLDVYRGIVEVFQVTLKCLDQDAQSTQVH
jgi:hypothetical protein